MCHINITMKKEEIISILSGWNFWGRGLPTGVDRITYRDRITRLLTGVNKIITVYGVRRAGKSYILRQCAYSLSSKLGVKNILYVNFEEVGFPEILDKDFLKNIVGAYTEILKPSIKPVLIFDEIQEVRGWEKVIRSMHEKDLSHIIISGSSSKLMSGELATILSGRDIPVEIFPLDFMEYLKFKNFRAENYSDILIKSEEIIKLLREYLEYGGFPEVVLEGNLTKKLEILSRYYETILIKDVVKRFRVRDYGKLDMLARFYISNASNPTSYRNIARILEIPLKTVERYSEHIYTSRIIIGINRYSPSYRVRTVSPKKIYVIDPGIFTSKGFKLSENIGRLMENIVCVELIRRYGGENIFYYKTYNGREVDFIIIKGDKIIKMIQVTYSENKKDIDKREVKAVLRASKELKCRDIEIITWDYDEVETYDNVNIQYIPLWKWLLTKNA